MRVLVSGAIGEGGRRPAVIDYDRRRFRRRLRRLRVGDVRSG